MADYQLTQTGAEVQTILNSVGDLDDLQTPVKTSVVDAINNVRSQASTIAGNLGTLSDLTTTDKSNAVAAINEVNSGKLSKWATAIWTNPDVTQNMDASTEISIAALSDYTYILIQVQAQTTSTLDQFIIAEVGRSAVSTFGAPSYSYRRSFTIASDKITMSDAVRVGSGTYNNWCIPYKVFGLF